jgi:hypothetical protein
MTSKLSINLRKVTLSTALSLASLLCVPINNVFAETAIDTDADGIMDTNDNCVFIPNSDQRDVDNDGYGSVCDADLNNDHIVNAADLAIFKPLLDSGDANADFNGDGVVDNLDLAILEQQFFGPPGPSQPDSDADGIPDKSDNCTLTANSDQRDIDSDGYGSACDADLNNDLIVNAADLGMFKLAYGSSDANADFNGDGVVDATDLALVKAQFFGPPGPSQPDSDADGIPDKSDNCTLVANPDQRDADGDGYGSMCDADLDNDHIVIYSDLAIFKQAFDTSDANADFNGDGVVDALDLEILKEQYFGPPGPSQPDSDGDGIPDKSDNCTLVANPDQRDADGDGYGSLCDADLNNDKIVNAADLALFKQVFGSGDANADFNGDGVVDDLDLALIKEQFFGAPGPSGLIQ